MNYNRPNVLVTFDSMKYPNTGLYYFGQSLGRALAEQNNDQFNLSYYLDPGTSQLFNKENIQKIFREKYHKIAFLNEDRFDLYHFTDQMSRLKPKKIWRKKKILTIHDINQVHEKHADPEKLKIYLKKLGERITASNKIVAISNFAANDVVKYFPEAANKISVIYNGADKLMLKDNHKPVYIPKNPFLFTIGIVSEKKNAHVLPSLLSGNNFELIISGIETPYKAKVLAEAKKFNCENRVIITGPITDDDKAWYYKNCEAFVFPSIAEGFGLPPIEAMHFGKPVFLANATSLPEIGGDSAYYFDDFNPEGMQKTLINGLDDFHKNKLAAKSIKHANQFDWNKTAQQYLKLYQECIGE